MKRLKWVLLLLVLSMGNFVGCGRQYSGTYNGNATFTPQNNLSQGIVNPLLNQIQTGTVTLTLTQNGNSITGSWSSQTANGSATGQLTGGQVNGDTITGVSLSLTINNSNSSIISIGSSGTIQCLYMGTITASGNWPVTDLNAILSPLNINNNNMMISTIGMNQCPTLAIQNLVKVN